MLCERALTRYVHGSLLAEKQMIQDWVAESYAEMQAARLLTLQAAWKMDELHAQGRHYSDARVEIGLIKFWGAKVLYNVIDRAIQVHGSLGYTTDLPLEGMYRAARAARIYDGPDEVHKVTVARQVLKRYKASEVPTEHVPTRRKAAEPKFADYLDQAAVSATCLGSPPQCACCAPVEQRVGAEERHEAVTRAAAVQRRRPERRARSPGWGSRRRRRPVSHQPSSSAKQLVGVVAHARDHAPLHDVGGALDLLAQVAARRRQLVAVEQPARPQPVARRRRARPRSSPASAPTT